MARPDSRAAGKKQAANPDGSMTLLEHMSELRKCLVIIAAAFLVFSVVGYYFAPRFMSGCLSMAEGYTFVQISPAELLGQYVLVGIIVGVVVALPVFIWQAHRFARPGLTKEEDRIFLGVMLSGVLFFALGALFCYFIVVPFMLQFFLSLNTIDIQGMYSVKEYMSYLIGVIVAFGIIFEIPVLSSILALIGVLKPEPMRKAGRVVIVVCFVIGAAITPTDVLSQLLVAVPMCLLYYLSIALVRVIARSRAKRHPEDAEKEQRQAAADQAERKARWERAKAMAEQPKGEEDRN